MINRYIRRTHLAIMVFGACATAGAQTPTLVRSTEAPMWGTGVRLIQEMRIGVVDGDDNYMLGSVVAVAAGRNGTTIVADGQGPIVRMYDSSG